MLSFQCGINIHQLQWDITKATARKIALLLYISECTEYQYEHNTNCIPNCTL